MAGMTGLGTQTITSAGNAFKLATPDRYISLGDFINTVNKPDNRTQLIKTFGNQGITGFLQLVGAVKTAGTADEVQWWEEQRLHPTANFTATGTVTAAKNITIPFTTSSSGNTFNLRVNDVVLWNSVQRAIVAAITSSTVTLSNLADATLSGAVSGIAYSLPVIGNLYGQGTDQPTQFLESNVVRRTNPYMIMKEIYKVTGSQATNIGWVDVGGGDYRWFIKGEADTRQRFIDKREMMLLLGQKVGNTTNVAAATYGGGSEGYFAAVEDRGMVHSGLVNTVAELDIIVKEFDKQGAGAEYALYVNRDQDLAIDDMLATGIGTLSSNGVSGQFGAFNNSADMAIKLGFKSFTRGGYTFHKHDWKLLNDPTLLGGSDFKGVAIPMSTVVDPQSGDRNPSLEINYKSTNGYSREMEHWMTGSFMGATNDTKDIAQFNYRSELALVTRAANRHMLIK